MDKNQSINKNQVLAKLEDHCSMIAHNIVASDIVWCCLGSCLKACCKR